MATYLATNIGSATRQSGVGLVTVPSGSSARHSTAHQALNDLYNRHIDGLVLIGAGARPPAYVPVDSNQLMIQDGSEALPRTNYQPSLLVSRVELIPDTSHANDPNRFATISGHVLSLVGNKSQAVGVYGGSIGTAVAGAYVIGVWAQGDHKEGSGGTSAGLYAQASTSVVGAGAQIIASALQNVSGADQPYVATGNAMTGFDAYYLNSADGSGSNYAGAGIQLRAIGGLVQWDAGYAVLVGAVRNWAFRDDSSAGVSYKDAGTHANGIDQSTASISGYAAYFRATNGAVGINNRAAGQQASVAMFDNAVPKWQLLKDTDNTFKLIDYANSKALLQGLTDSTLVVGSVGKKVGFYGSVGSLLQTGVPVTAAGIHAALVALGLITA